MKIFIHINASSTYIGNGGFVVLTNLANELALIGYDVSVFDQQDRLNLKMFEWLSLPECNFAIVNVDEIIHSNPNDYRLITTWLKRLPMKLRNDSLRYLETSELLRVGHDEERGYLLKNTVKIANPHRALKSYYHNMGFKNIIDFDVWIRNDACNDRPKISGSVGIQLERNQGKIARILSRLGIARYNFKRYNHFKNHDLIFCNGTYAKVLENMKKADFFIHNPQPSPHITMFQGEAFGLPLFEAMACGCVCIAKEHRGISFLRGTIPVVDSTDEACEVLENLMADLDEKEKIRERSVEFIERNYRFNETRKQAIKELLE